MGILDLLFPNCEQRNIPHENLPLVPRPPSAPEAGNCVNCHQSPPTSNTCSAQAAWPRELYRIIPSIQQQPARYAWWQQNNHSATWMRHQVAQQRLPLQLGDVQVHLEVAPDEPQLEGVASWVLTESSVLSANIHGQGTHLLLNRGNLAEVSDTLLGDLAVRFDRGLTTNSWLINFFKDFNNNILQAMPVAYDPQSHRLYTLSEYIQNYYDVFPLDPDVQRGIQNSPLYSQNPDTLYSSLPFRTREAFLQIIESMQGGEVWVLQKAQAIHLQRFPYLFELAVDLTTRRNEPGNIDLSRLFPELVQAFQMSPTSSVQNNSPWYAGLRHMLGMTHYALLNVDLHPQRVFGEAFDLQFKPESNVSIHIRTRGSELRSVTSHSHFAFDRVVIPGVLSLGESSFDLEGRGPDLNLSLRNLNLNFSEFDVAAPDLAHRGAVHISRGRVTDAAPVYYEQGEIPSGISVRGRLQHGLELGVNVNLDARLNYHNEAYHVSGQMLGAARLADLEWEVGRTFFEIRNLTLRNGNSNPLFENARLTVTDMPERIGSDRHGFLISLDIPVQNFPLLDHYRNLHFQTFIPISTYHAQQGSWAQFFDSLGARRGMDHSLVSDPGSPFETPLRAGENGALRVLPLDEAGGPFASFWASRAGDFQTQGGNVFVRILPAESMYFGSVPVLSSTQERLSDERYDASSLIREFDLPVDIQMQGRNGTPNIRGNIHFNSRQQGTCSRSYDLSAEVNQFSAVLAPALDLVLRNLQFALTARHTLESGAIQNIEIPRLSLSANQNRAPQAGVLQGAANIYHQGNSGRLPIRIRYNPEAGSDSHSELDVRDFRLRFSADRIVHPAILNSARDSEGRPSVRGLDVGGILRTDRWTHNLSRNSGTGLVCLRGSPAGDVFLRDSQNRRIHPPLLEDSLWCAMQVSRYDSQHQILYGAFLLDLGIDLNDLRPYGININSSGSLGLYSDNLPLSAQGYDWIQRMFLRRLGLQRAQVSQIENGGRP